MGWSDRASSPLAKLFNAGVWSLVTPKTNFILSRGFVGGLAEEVSFFGES